MNTIEQNIKRIIDQEIFVNASIMVTDLQNTGSHWVDHLIDCQIKDDYETPVRDAIADITPAGLLDVCECVLGCELLDKDGNAIVDADELDHDLSLIHI